MRYLKLDVLSPVPADIVVSRSQTPKPITLVGYRSKTIRIPFLERLLILLFVFILFSILFKIVSTISRGSFFLKKTNTSNRSVILETLS